MGSSSLGVSLALALQEGRVSSKDWRILLPQAAEGLSLLPIPDHIAADKILHQKPVRFPDWRDGYHVLRTQPPKRV